MAVGLIEAIRHLGRIEPGAAMGVTFTTLFAGGVLLLEEGGVRVLGQGWSPAAASRDGRIGGAAVRGLRHGRARAAGRSAAGRSAAGRSAAGRSGGVYGRAAGRRGRIVCARNG